MITFFKVSKLIKQLRNDTVSEGEVFGYFLFTTVLLGLFNAHDKDFSNLMLLPFTSDKLLPLVYSLVSNLIILLVATYLTWRANMQGDGKKFLERYFCLSVPAGMWSLVGVLVLSIPMAILSLAHILFPGIPKVDLGPLGPALFDNFATALPCFLIYKWIKEVAKTSPSENSAPQDDPLLKPLVVTLTVVGLIFIGTLLIKFSTSQLHKKIDTLSEPKPEAPPKDPVE